jgi:hypothetical protein
MHWVHNQAPKGIAMSIVPHSNESQTQWDHGKFKVQLVQANHPRPFGFCDGSAEDEAELESIAEAEGAVDFSIHKKVLKTGREIWTLGAGG